MVVNNVNHQDFVLNGNVISLDGNQPLSGTAASEAGSPTMFKSQYRIRQILPSGDVLYSPCATDNIRILKWNLWRLRDRDDMSKYAIVDEEGKLYPQLLIDAIAEDIERTANWQKRRDAKAIAEKEKCKRLVKRLKQCK